MTWLITRLCAHAPYLLLAGYYLLFHLPYQRGSLWAATGLVIALFVFGHAIKFIAEGIGAVNGAVNGDRTYFDLGIELAEWEAAKRRLKRQRGGDRDGTARVCADRQTMPPA